MPGSWIGARCEYCSAEWTAASKGKPLRYDYADDAIVCGRGYGCARRRPEHERATVLVDALDRRVRTKQFLYEGHWYTAVELAAIAEVNVAQMRARLALGWIVEHALAPTFNFPKGVRPANYDGRLRTALARAGGTPWKRPPNQPDAPRGRPGRFPGISAAARELGIPVQTFASRVHRLGSIEAARAASGSSRSNGVTAAARKIGVSRQTLARWARLLGSLDAAIEAYRQRQRRAA